MAFNGSFGSDTIYGGAFADYMAGSYSASQDADFFYGRGGNDSLRGDYGDDYLDGGDGNDTLEVNLGADTALGGGGDDVFLKLDILDSLDGGAGNDRFELTAAGGNFAIDMQTSTQFINFEAVTLYNGGGVNNFRGTNGADFIGDMFYIYDDNAADTFDGAGGDDTLVSYGIGDLLIGGEGNDQLSGSNATLNGGNGDDTIFSDFSSVIDGGAGKDFLTFNAGAVTSSAYINGLNLDLQSSTAVLNIEQANISGGNGVDTLGGGEFADTLAGGQGNDIYYARGGDDIIYAGEGADTVFAGSGNDIVTINGGTTAHGGEGVDRLDVFLTTTGETIDIDLQMATNQFSGFESVVYRSSNSVTGKVRGGDATDAFFGSTGNDLFWGRGGNDDIWGGGGQDTIDAGDGDD